MNQAAEGVRLAKRVAALQACSRSQAEALIAAGAVQVQGQVVTDPACRVAEDVLVQVSSGAAVGAITVLLHKPAGMAAAQALREGWPALGLGESPPPGLQELLPLPRQAAGLSVWSDERPVARRMLDREHPLEIEWLLSLPLARARTVIGPLQSAGLRICLGHDRDGVGHWRMVEKVDPTRSWVDFLEQGPLRGAWALRRQRIGRLGLSPLASGEGRVRRDFEKF